MSNRITEGSRVEPRVQPTKSDISYGYVRRIWTGTADMDGSHYAGRLMAHVYWPEIRSDGRWPVDELRAL